MLRERPASSIFGPTEIWSLDRGLFPTPPNRLEGHRTLAHLWHLQLNGSFGGMHPDALVAIAVAPQRPLRASLVAFSSRKIAHFGGFYGPLQDQVAPLRRAASPNGSVSLTNPSVSSCFILSLGAILLSSWCSLLFFGASFRSVVLISQEITPFSLLQEGCDIS